ncbi:MAG: hypothetical protein NVS2B12_33890 [Ktedonobacteraceae bacterium]
MHFFPFFALMLIFRLLGSLFWVALLALLIFGLVRMVTRNTGPNFFFRSGPFATDHRPQQPPQSYYQPQQPSAMEILNQRYAHGEIDAVTFDQMRERLQAAEQPLQQQG